MKVNAFTILGVLLAISGIYGIVESSKSLAYIPLGIILVIIGIVLFKKGLNYVAKPKSSKPAKQKKWLIFETRVDGIANPKGQKLLGAINKKISSDDEYIPDTKLKDYANDDGEIAVAVFVDDRKIGNVPPSHAEQVIDIIDYIKWADINIIDGKQDKVICSDGNFADMDDLDHTPCLYGAKLVIKYKNQAN
ncbi:hypothetical protein NIA71_01150 [Ihubacter massiliensis]|uniref:hypothetical protein n=1 Tax=Ihubacter massiliensis TaxID=1852367 RepID=UPI002097CC68|nr:hypothetical protein [Ihubacter massiliensis]MCI7301479.1 hypothetical protein [Clostridia bacterium]MCO7120561.1 hypothetical protein [Ihubacter massiliensis]MDY3010632.1 hypothetical protein [Clostridiales Family XIII bacterium]